MLKCTFVSPTKKIQRENLDGIYIKTITGERGILKDHIPLVCKLQNNSVVRLKKKNEKKSEVEKYLVGTESYLQFKNNEAIILTQDFLKTEEY